jgi:TonB family protein
MSLASASLAARPAQAAIAVLASMPTLQCEVEPHYTPPARAAKLEGRVVVEAEVLTDGTVGDVRVAKSLDPTLGLDDAAYAAAKRCHGKPGELGKGNPIVTTMPLTFVFRLHRPGLVEGDPASQSAEDLAFAGDAYSLRSHGIVVPRLLTQVPPSYTAGAMRAKVQGDVVLEAVVGPDGVVRATRVLVSLDGGDLDYSADRALRQWRFSPGTLNGQPVAVVITANLQFRLH